MVAGEVSVWPGAAAGEQTSGARPAAATAVQSAAVPQEGQQVRAGDAAVQLGQASAGQPDQVQGLLLGPLGRHLRRPELRRD